jgi:hypothetical protein
MGQSFEAEAHPKLFEFIDEQTGLSPVGILLAAEDLLRAAGHFPGSKGPKGWRKRVYGFGKGTKDRKPICTRTGQEAMRLADHFHPDPGQTIPGCWVPYP